MGYTFLRYFFWMTDRGGNKGGAAARRRGTGAASGRFWTFFGRVVFVKPSRQRQPEPSATRIFFCEPIIFSSVKIDPFCAVSRWGGRYPVLRRFDFYPPPSRVAAQARRPTIAKPGHLFPLGAFCPFRELFSVEPDCVLSVPASFLAKLGFSAGCTLGASAPHIPRKRRSAWLEWPARAEI